MNWVHKCDLGWLKERQRYLTASDIKNLLPVTKTGRKRTVGEEEYLKVMASKMVTLTEEDCLSFGAAARGHVLEPYAIDSLNATLQTNKIHDYFFWWDDKLITQPGRLLAFSPDGMNVDMNDEDAADKTTAIAEVKSYTAEKHLVTAYTPKDRIEERWQIASAMALLPNIERAYLELYNPSMKYRRSYVIRFDRDELMDEIDTVLEIERNWRNFRMFGLVTKPAANGAIYSHYGPSEESIRKSYDIDKTLNPVV